jgi:hypothetical protein
MHYRTGWKEWLSSKSPRGAADKHSTRKDSSHVGKAAGGSSHAAAAGTGGTPNKPKPQDFMQQLVLAENSDESLGRVARNLSPLK